MATDNESFNRDLYDLLKVRGYQPVPLDSKNQRVPASQAADVIQFTFTKDGEEYGKAWVSIDDAANIIVYYDEEQQESPSNATPGVEYNDTWTGFLKHLKNWAQRRQLSFELSNKDRLGDDMRQRDYYKMKERVSEGYYPMGKKVNSVIVTLLKSILKTLMAKDSLLQLPVLVSLVYMLVTSQKVAYPMMIDGTILSQSVKIITRWPVLFVLPVTDSSTNQQLKWFKKA